MGRRPARDHILVTATGNLTSWFGKPVRGRWDIEMACCGLRIKLQVGRRKEAACDNRAHSIYKSRHRIGFSLGGRDGGGALWWLKYRLGSRMRLAGICQHAWFTVVGCFRNYMAANHLTVLLMQFICKEISLFYTTDLRTLFYFLFLFFSRYFPTWWFIFCLQQWQFLFLSW